MFRRFVLPAAIAALALVAVATPVSAHIDPDPKQAQAGARLTAGFTVEHGCEGSPTVQLDMRLPDGVVDAVAEEVDGWTGSVEIVDGDTIVSFADGRLADDVEGTFEVTMTLPPTPDTTIYFPFVQRCEVGEIRWIGIPAEPGDVLDEPAPAMRLTGPVATTVPTTAPPAAPTSTDAVTTTTAAPATTPATAVPTTTPATTDASPATTEPTSSTSEPVVVAGGSGQGGSGQGASSTTGTIAFAVSVIAVLAVFGFAAWRARVNKAATATATGAATAGDVG